MTRVEPFDKGAERFTSQQKRRFSLRFLVRFPPAFTTSLFQAFQKVVKSPPSADKIEPPFHPSETVLLQRSPNIPSSKTYAYRGAQPPFSIPLLLTSF
ncbi:hypothetical protein AVEN_173464-1 [Araneus ventricosus]|uniref:Uncharacterized protein n=1 Tax=Araneus ventricosus TaxID=182803 RepID=A0A4Y2WW12_ARAVE|nr:hypothetical protein AVEN_173464-1 [Araneus ventricosus]